MDDLRDFPQDDDYDTFYGFCMDCGNELNSHQACDDCDDLAEKRQMYREDEG